MMLAMHFLKGLFHEHHARVYLDHAAATPIRHQVWDVMVPLFKQTYGNPSSIHAEGVAAKRALEAAREGVARTLAVRGDDVVFTSGGTEANNLALLGFIKALHKAGRDYTTMQVVTTELEHPSLTEAVGELTNLGVAVVYAPVREDGIIDVATLPTLINDQTVALATSYVNSEVGVVQPLRKIKKILQERSPAILIADGAQAPLWLPCQLEALGVDILTLDGGKIYGPKGIGVVAKRHGIALSAVTAGGGQEFQLRPGTESVALAAGFEMALLLAQRTQAVRAEGVEKLRNYFLAELLKIPKVVVNGSTKERVANNVNISLPGYDTEYAAVVLDKNGISVSTKSACSGAGGGQSSVVMALYNDPARARTTLRFTLGEVTSQADLDFTVDILKKHLTTMAPFDQIK